MQRQLVARETSRSSAQRPLRETAAKRTSLLINLSGPAIKLNMPSDIARLPPNAAGVQVATRARVCQGGVVGCSDHQRPLARVQRHLVLEIVGRKRTLVLRDGVCHRGERHYLCAWSAHIRYVLALRPTACSRARPHARMSCQSCRRTERVRKVERCSQCSRSIQPPAQQNPAPAVPTTKGIADGMVRCPRARSPETEAREQPQQQPSWNTRWKQTLQRLAASSVSLSSQI